MSMRGSAIRSHDVRYQSYSVVVVAPVHWRSNAARLLKASLDQGVNACGRSHGALLCISAFCLFVGAGGHSSTFARSSTWIGG